MGSTSLALDGRGRLPLGRHRAPSADVYALFVDQAPFRSDRERVWEALLLWAARIRPLVPHGRLWLDGGFVTHKQWAAPKDVDVAMILSPTDYAARDVAALAPLLTDNPAGGPRRQPMGGLVDAFVGQQGPSALYWAQTWTTVTDENRDVVLGERKGFVEVIDL